jgi:hypothetical protein
MKYKFYIESSTILSNNALKNKHTIIHMQNNKTMGGNYCHYSGATTEQIRKKKHC